MAEPTARKRNARAGNDLIRERIVQDLINRSSKEFQDYMARQGGGAMPPVGYPGVGSGLGPQPMPPVGYPGVGSPLSQMGSPMPPVPFPGNGSPLLPAMPTLTPATPPPADPRSEALLRFFGLI